MDRKVEIAIEGKVGVTLDEAAVERAKARAAEVEGAAKKAAGALAQLEDRAAVLEEHLGKVLGSGREREAPESPEGRGPTPGAGPREAEQLREELARLREEIARLRGEGLSLDEAAVERALRGAHRAALGEEPPQEAPQARGIQARGQEPRVTPTPTPLEAAYARALGADHPLYRRVFRGLESLEAQVAGARTQGDFARLEARTAVLERYLEQALAVGADPKVAERLKEELARLREEIARDREERARGRLTGGGGQGGLPGGGPPGSGQGGEEGGEGGGGPFGGLGPLTRTAGDLFRRAAQGGLARFGPLGAVLARLGPWGMALGGVGALIGGVDLVSRILEGMNREARGEAMETADLARLLEYSRNPLTFFRQPGTLYPEQYLLQLGYTARDAQKIALAYGLPGGIQGDVRNILAFAATTGLGEEPAVRAARELGLLGLGRGQVGQGLEVLKAAMAEGVKEGVDKASTLQGLLRLSQEAASRGVQVTTTGLAFQSALQAALAGTGNRLLQGEMGANAQGALKEAFAGLGDVGLQMYLVNVLGGLPKAEQLGLKGAEARGYERLVRADPARAMEIALRLLPERNPQLWATLVERAERGLGTPLLSGLLTSAGLQGEQLLTLLGTGVGSLAERAARRAPQMRQDLLEDPQAGNRLAWESRQMDARRRAIEEANQLATLAATREAEKATRDFTDALKGAAAAIKRAFGEDILAPGEGYRGRVGSAVRLPGGSAAPRPAPPQVGRGSLTDRLPALQEQAQAEAAVSRALREQGVTGITMGVGQRYRDEVRRQFPQLPEYHRGLDVVYGDPKRPGDPVPSPFAATVKRVGHDPKGYGNYVVLDVGGREVIAGHLQEVKVKPGDKVRPGDLLGLEGQTGAATGPHVHWEIRRDGKPVTDQREFFRLWYELMRPRQGDGGGKEKEKRGDLPGRQEVVVRVEGLDRIRVEGVSGPQADRIRQGIELILSGAVPENHRGS
jgi:murein DD-endopeptidase MepM/ murein hydrolase activator NlpD